MPRPVLRPRRVGAVTACAVAAVGLSAWIPAAATPPAPSPSGPAAGRTSAPVPLDARQGGSRAERDALGAKHARLEASAPVRALSRSLGRQAVVDMDPLTSTPRQVSRLDGLLTGPSRAAARDVALAYVRAHSGVFRLSGSDLAGLKLSRDYVDIAGVHHVSFTQHVAGVPLFGNGLKANVTKDGRLISVSGSPQPSLHAPTQARSLTADAAIRRAKQDTAERSVAPARGDTAKKVLFQTTGGTRAAWQTVTMSAARPTLDVVDAAGGRLLYRQSLASDYAPQGPSAASGGEYADVVDNYLGAPRGGTPHTVSLNRPGWLPRGGVVLYGNNTHTYTDVNDNNQADPTEEVSATGRQGFRFPVVRTRVGDEPCVTFWCTWDPKKANSWQANAARTATQNFYFINVWHDYLAQAPIGFTEAAGNFQQVNRSGQGLGGDAVLDQPLDGANTANGLPDGNHIDNANFATPPDGQSPTMQMYLWHEPGLTYQQDPFLAVSGSDEADIVFHEYTHGLSHRLVVDAANNPALDSQQGGSMGEAWSDFYASDYLVDKGYVRDGSKPGDVLIGPYVAAGRTIRTEPLDCRVDSPASVCPGTTNAGPGGYTYGDLGKISRRGPEVHADGEIWAQTLWDLRGRLGSRLTDSLVTRAMELSPTAPSMLDMRNSIVLADQAIYAGKHVSALWTLFAARGMGFFAGTLGGNDTSPVESFSLPPGPNTPTATLSGTVTDSQSRAGIGGVTVAFGGHDSGFPGDYAATTDAQGKYSIAGIFPGTYPDVYASGAGYNPEVRPAVSVNSGRTTVDWSLQRDWAASSGGAAITKATGADYSGYGCGPAGLIDQSQASGWGNVSDLDAAGRPTAATAKYAVIKLPKAVDITSVTVDPSNTCGDDPTAATGGYQVDTSTDGARWTKAATGTFTPADLGKLNAVALTAGTTAKVAYVRFWMLTPQAVTQHVTCPSPTGASGCQFLDSSELEVFGTASPAA